LKKKQLHEEDFRRTCQLEKRTLIFSFFIIFG